MKVLPTDLEGVVIIEPRVFEDERGFFFESYHGARYAAAGLPERFVQDNHSRSVSGTIRGLHYQLKRPQGKLVRAVLGRVLDVAADIRRGSPNFGRWVAVELSAANKRQLYIPPGFAHGFCVLEGPAEVEYKCTDYYQANDQRGVRWDDPTLGVPWPVSAPVVSPQDRALEHLSPERDDLPAFRRDLG